MGLNVAQKIIQAHLVEGAMVPGQDIAIRMDQTLTQDATGTMAYLQFEALGVPAARTDLSVSYVDHNMLQGGFENADDHKFLETIASKYGIQFSRPGNGVCHQLHLERFGEPGKTLIGSDSHTPTAGGLGMLAIGAGGLDVALAVAGQPFHLSMPRVVEVKLTGRLHPFVSAKDIILELLRRLTVKGGVGKVMEFTGDGVATLSVPERATITNMGAELGATSSLFPSDAETRKWLAAQGRTEVWREVLPDGDAAYDEHIEIDLSSLEPMVAKPHSPDNVAKVSEAGGIRVNQVVIGSCTNSSYRDLMTVVNMLRGRRISPEVSVGVQPGSRQVLLELARNGGLEVLLRSGVRLLEATCGACIGMGFAPPTDGVSVRTFNRNFEGRSGTKSGQVYLTSPETAVAAALTGRLTDPRSLGIPYEAVQLPEKFDVDDSMVLAPAGNPADVQIVRGPNIQPLPIKEPLADGVEGKVLLKVGDNITTDHIMPAGAKILPLRSNVPKIAEHVFEAIDPTFPRRAREAGGGFVIGGINYGQGSSREHAALAPMYLGVKAVIVKSFARIHLANLINFGILPFVFANESDYDGIEQGDQLDIDLSTLDTGHVILHNRTRNAEIRLDCPLTGRDIEIVRAGGSLPHIRASLIAAGR